MMAESMRVKCQARTHSSVQLLRLKEGKRGANSAGDQRANKASLRGMAGVSVGRGSNSYDEAAADHGGQKAGMSIARCSHDSYVEHRSALETIPGSVRTSRQIAKQEFIRGARESATQRWTVGVSDQHFLAICDSLSAGP